MKSETRNKWIAIVVFYIIAVALRASAFLLQDILTIKDNMLTYDIWYMLYSWTSGMGPCLGALAAVFLFRRKFYIGITGSSAVKSVVSVLIPFVVCFFMYRDLSYVLLGFILYSFLEEVGWRGYLQGELMDRKPLLQAMIIGTMWFFWHIRINLIGDGQSGMTFLSWLTEQLRMYFSMNGLVFWSLLVFGAWGIGRVANETHSLVACACFHTLYNFSIHGFFKFTPVVIGVYVAVVISWVAIWFVPWDRVFSRRKA